MIAARSALVLLFALACLGASPAIAFNLFDDSPRNGLRDFAKRIPEGAKVVVLDPEDGKTRDVTKFGKYWQREIESRLTKHDITILDRDAAMLAEEETEMYGGKRIDKASDVIVFAQYFLDDPSSGRFRITLRALKRKDSTLIATAELKRLKLQDGWRADETTFLYNPNKKSVHSLFGDKGPKLEAKLNRKNKCYPSNTEATITIKAEDGAYIYILQVSQDETAVLLHPSKITPANKMLGGTYEFPPPPLRQSMGFRLIMVPLDKRDTREVFKIIASKKPLDFSFLPQPINEVFVGAKGGDLAKMTQTIKAAKDISVATLDYWVGPACGAGVR